MNTALVAIAVAVAASVAAGCVLLEPAATPVQATAKQATSMQTIDERDECGAKSLVHLIGRKLGDPGVPTASPKVRHIGPGDAVTEDLRIDRLNIYVTGAGVIEMINCG